MPNEQESIDLSNGYEAVAARLIQRRDRSIGVATVRKWAKLLPSGADVLDLGCGHGVPISEALMTDGFVVHGIDASASLAAEFQRRFPEASIACEAAEHSTFFGKSFDGVVAVGLVFLIDAEAQEKLIRRVAEALKPGGRFLFTAPTQRATWQDILTGRLSVSLGADAYTTILSEARLGLEDEYVDEGQNHYYACVRR